MRSERSSSSGSEMNNASARAPCGQLRSLEQLARSRERRTQRHQLRVRALVALDLAVCAVEQRSRLARARRRRGEARRIEVQVDAQHAFLRGPHRCERPDELLADFGHQRHQPRAYPDSRAAYSSSSDTFGSGCAPGGACASSARLAFASSSLLRLVRGRILRVELDQRVARSRPQWRCRAYHL